MSNKYIVVYGENVDVEEFDDYNEAIYFIEDGDISELKAVLIKIENICDQTMANPTTVKIEYHT